MINQTQNRDKYAIDKLPSDFDQLQLDEYIEGYKDNADNETVLDKAKLLFGIVVFLTATVFGFVEGIVYLIIFCGIPSGLLLYLFISILNKIPTNLFVYVFEGGVVVETIESRTQQRSKLDVYPFADVTSFVSHIQRSYGRSSYTCTDRSITMVLTNSETMELMGSYNDEKETGKGFTWIWFVVKAIEAQWCKLNMPRILQEFQDTNELLFVTRKNHTVKLTKEGVYYKGKFIATENLQLTCRRKEVDAAIFLCDTSIKPSLVNKIARNNGFLISLDGMKDGCLFVAALQSIYGLQLYTPVE